MRSAGSNLGKLEQNIGSLQARIRYEEERGRGDGPRAQQLRGYLAAQQQEYDQTRQAYESRGVDYQDAVKAAPKNYRTDLANAGNYAGGQAMPNRVNSIYDPSRRQQRQVYAADQYGNQTLVATTTSYRPTGYTGVKGSPNDPRNRGVQGFSPQKRLAVSTREVTKEEQFDRVQRQEAAKRPGIYYLSDGSAVTSSLADGQYSRTVSVRTPVATGLGGERIYAPRAQPVSGFDLFDPGTREAIAQSAPQFKTAGSLYGAAAVSTNEKPFKANNTSQENGTSKSSGRNAQEYNNLSNRNINYVLRGQVLPDQKQKQNKERIEATEQRVTALEKSRENFYQSPNLQSLSQSSEKVGSFVTFGANIKRVPGSKFNQPLSEQFIIEPTPLNQRSTIGGGSQLFVESIFNAPPALAAETIYTPAKFYAAADVARFPDKTQITGGVVKGSRSNVAREVFITAPREVEAGPYSLFPGGTPINKEGVATGITAITGGLAKGYNDFNVARRTPSNVKFTADSAVASDVVAARGGVSGSARVVGSAEVTYKYGPAKMFTRTQVVPAQGSVVFSGLRTAGRGGNYAVSVEGVAQTVVPTGTKTAVNIGQRTITRKPVSKTFNSDVNFRGNYNAQTGRLALTNGEQVFISQPGKSTPVSTVTGTRTAPSTGAVLAKDRYGNFAVQRLSRARGFAEGGQVNTYAFARSQQGFNFDTVASGPTASYIETRGGLAPRGSRFVGDAEQVVKSRVSQGASQKLVDRGFNDLQRQGFYSPKEISVGPGFADRARQLVRSRKGSAGSGQLLVQEPSTVLRPPARSSVRSFRQPSFGGLPLGELSFRQPKYFSPSYAVAAQGTRSSVRSDAKIAPVSLQSPKLSFARTPVQENVPKLVVSQVPSTKPAVAQDTTPVLRYDTTQRTSFRPRTPSPLKPDFDFSFRPDGGLPFVPPPPFIGFPGGGGSFGAESPRRAGGERGYTPSLYGIAAGVKGKASAGAIKTGLGVRGVVTPRKKRKSAVVGATGGFS